MSSAARTVTDTKCVIVCFVHYFFLWLNPPSKNQSILQTSYAGKCKFASNVCINNMFSVHSVVRIGWRCGQLYKHEDLHAVTIIWISSEFCGCSSAWVGVCACASIYLYDYSAIITEYQRSSKLKYAHKFARTAFEYVIANSVWAHAVTYLSQWAWPESVTSVVFRVHVCLIMHLYTHAQTLGNHHNPLIICI